MTPIRYNNNITSYQVSGTVNSFCAEITFINNGTTNVTINNALVLQPTQSISFDGKQNELDTTFYTLVFQGVGQNICVVIRKFYNQDVVYS